MLHPTCRGPMLQLSTTPPPTALPSFGLLCRCVPPPLALPYAALPSPSLLPTSPWWLRHRPASSPLCSGNGGLLPVVPSLFPPVGTAARLLPSGSAFARLHLGRWLHLPRPDSAPDLLAARWPHSSVNESEEERKIGNDECVHYISFCWNGFESPDLKAPLKVG